MANDLSPFELEFMRKLPRDVTTNPRERSAMTSAERQTMVALQGKGLIRVHVASAYTAKVLLTDKGRAALGRGA